MNKAFNKGDKVTIIGDWDRLGTCWYQDAIVYSCGKKRMVLTCEKTGEELGRNFKPERGEIGNIGVFPRMTCDEAIIATLAAAETIIKNETAQLNKMISMRDDDDFKCYLQKQLELIHEPKAGLKSDLIAALRSGA